jgi:lipopolysaccharide export system permease protein
VKIIHKYVLREHVGPFVFALTALTSLLLLNYIAKQIDELVGKGLSAGVIGQFFALSLPFTVAMTTPMSVLVATLYAFSRLASENEVTALKANGISLSRLLVPVLISASFISVGMVWFNDVVLPASNHQLRKLQTDIARKKPTFALKEQVINQVSPDRHVYLKAMKLSTDNRMKGVTIYDLSDVMRRRTIYADSGELAFAPNGKDLVLTLYNGSTLEVPRGEPTQLQRASFDQNFVRVEGVANQLEMTRRDDFKSDREMTICELQNDVARYEAEYIKARDDLRKALLDLTNEALNGVAAKPSEISGTPIMNVKPGAPTTRSSNPSLGRAYCDATMAVKRARTRAATALIPSLYAATTGQQPGPPSPPPPPQNPTSVPDYTAIAQGPAPGVLYHRPVVLSANIENARNRMRDNQRNVNTAAVELHKKFAISVACTVFILVGAPIALRFPRGGVGLVIGVSLVIFGIYYIGLIAGEALADKNIVPPFVAMWAANMLLTTVGVFLLLRMGRESATTRGGDFREMLDIIRNLFRRERAPVTGAR